MELQIVRKDVNSARVIGDLLVDGTWECFTLERAYTDPEHPCIPLGQYRVYPWNSPHFNRPVLRFASVPGRSDILIHVGNTTADSKGCILVGQDRSGDQILHSKLALDALLRKIRQTVDLVITQVP